jgi:hypothetical protein
MLMQARNIMSTSQLKKKAPLGVTIISLIFGIITIALLIGSVIVFVMADELKHQGPIERFVVAGFLIDFLLGVITFGLWKRKNWGRISAIVVTGLFLFPSFNTIIQRDAQAFVKNGWPFCLALLIFVYLFLPSVRRVFKSGAIK